MAADLAQLSPDTTDTQKVGRFTFYFTFSSQLPTILVGGIANTQGVLVQFSSAPFGASGQKIRREYVLAEAFFWAARRRLAAPKKKCGGGTLFMPWTFVFRAGGTAPPHPRFGEGGRKTKTITRYIGVLHYLECWRVNAADFRGSDGSYSSTRLPDKCIPTLNITYITTDAQ